MNQNKKLEAGNSAIKRKFKNFLLNPSYQLKYVLWLTGTGLCLVTLNAAVFYTYTKENYDFLVQMSPMTDEAKALLYHELHSIILTLLGISLLFCLLMGILGIVISHRTAGPLFHFKRVFNEIKKGNVNQRVRLRPKDDFKDVAQAFNEMMDQLHK